MGRLVEQVEALARGYVRKGGKTNRKQQAARMMAFATHCEGLGAAEMGQVGANHVLSYYRATAALNDSTRYNHFRALCVLWQLAQKPGLPPAPAASGSTVATRLPRPTAKPLFMTEDALQANVAGSDEVHAHQGSTLPRPQGGGSCNTFPEHADFDPPGF